MLTGFFVKFIIASGIIFTAGPLHNEGGAQAIQDKGAKAAILQAVDESEAEALTGNYGNK